MARRYFNVEPKVARLLEPGDRYPVEKTVESVVKTSADVLVTFDDGSSLRLGYTDALMVAAPLDPSPASDSAEASAVAAAVLADAEPTGDAEDEVDEGDVKAGGTGK